MEVPLSTAMRLPEDAGMRHANIRTIACSAKCLQDGLKDGFPGGSIAWIQVGEGEQVSLLDTL